MTTHQAVATTAKGVVDAIQVKTPEPGPGQILIKSHYASMMPFDVIVADLGFTVQNYPQVLGFNASGTVEKTGTGVEGFEIGDKVIAISFGARTLQEYVLSGVNECAKVPPNLSLDSAATIPDNVVTAFYIVFDQLKLHIPSEFPAVKAPPNADIPILIYGSGSTAGQYTIQVLKLAGYKKVIAVASPKHNDLLRSYGAAHVIDYNSPQLADNIIAAAGGKVSIAVDCISAQATLDAVSKVLSPEGTVAVLLPVKQGNDLNGLPLGEIPEDSNPFPKSVKTLYISAFLYQANDYLRENLFQKVLPPLLANGTIKPNKVRLMDQGSFKDRVLAGLDLLRNNKVSGEKVIVKIPA